MRTRYAPALVGGIVLWGILTVACSSAVDRPAPGGPSWDGSIDARSGSPLRGRALAVAWDDDARSDTLYRVGPRDLRLREGFPYHSRGTVAWDVSHDGSVLLATFKGGIRMIDVTRPREVMRYDFGVRGVRAAVWAGDDVAILVTVGRDKTQLVRFEPSTGTVLDLESIPGSMFTSADTGDGIVLLAYGIHEELPAQPEPATLAVMDASGEFASLRLDEVGAGHYLGSVGKMGTRALPGLAVRGARATVVGIDGKVVSVDLDSLEVTVESDDDSVLGELAAWFVPPAHAKSLDATELRAQWAGDDALLVSGYRTEGRETQNAGAVLLDAEDWSATVVDTEANGAHVARDHLLAWNVFMIGDERRDGIGLRSYAPDGALEWEVLEGQFVRMQSVHRGVAYVEHGWSRVLVSSVDLETGEILATRHSYVNVLPL